MLDNTPPEANLTSYWGWITQDELSNLNIGTSISSVFSNIIIIGNRVDLELVILVVVGLLLFRSLILNSRHFIKDKYPPGPPAFPFIGNVHQLSLDAWIPL